MSTQRTAEYLDEELSEQTICDHLAAHPDFFERHSALLSSLRLPHAAGGAVSLVERQVSVLRQKNLKLERQLKELIEVARANGVLATKIHDLALQLFAARDLSATIAAVEEAMRSGFNADQAVLVLFGDPGQFADLDFGRFFRVTERDDKALGPFSTFLKTSTPRCGQIRDSQRNYLFPANAEEVGSVALIPLGQNTDVGFLAIGSVDADRFHPGMSIDFLSRVGDLVSVAIKRN